MVNSTISKKPQAIGFAKSHHSLAPNFPEVNDVIYLYYSVLSGTLKNSSTESGNTIYDKYLFTHDQKSPVQFYWPVDCTSFNEFQETLELCMQLKLFTRQELVSFHCFLVILGVSLA